MQITSFRIWTRIALFTAFDGNRYATSACLYFIGNESDSIKKIEKQSNPKVMNL